MTPASALVVLLHGDSEHAARYHYAAARLQEAGHRVLAPEDSDPALRAVPRGRHVSAAVDHLDTLVRADLAQDERPVVLLAHGEGAVLGLRYAIDHQDRLTGLILASPLAQPKPGGVRGWLQEVGANLLPDAPPRQDPNLSNPDPVVDIDYLVEPVTRLGSGIAMSSANTAARRAAHITDGIDTLTLPVLLTWGTAEGLHPPGGAEHLIGTLEHTDLCRRPLDVLYHDILHGPGRAAALDTIVDWITTHVA